MSRDKIDVSRESSAPLAAGASPPGKADAPETGPFAVSRREFLGCVALAAAAAGVASPARAEGGAETAIAPFVDDEVLAVLRIDLTKFDPEGLLRTIFPDPEEAAEYARSVGPWAGALRKAGAKELFVVARPSDAPFPPPAIVPLGEGADAKAIGAILCGAAPLKGLMSLPSCATIHKAVFAGMPDALERAKSAKAVARPELAQALAESGDAAVQLLFVPSADQRRVLEEMLPNLPREFGGGPITPLSRGLLWASASLVGAPNPAVRLLIRARDAEAARGLGGVADRALAWLAQSPGVGGRSPEVGKIVAGLKPTVEGDRISLNIGLGQGSALVAAVQQSMRETFGRRQSVNNMKFIGLAMHNYLSQHGTFPPAFSRDKAGRPLLSWRVLILPYLEQQSLYDQFHLDEPWDSPHNRPLADRMPDVYRSPAASRKPAFRSKTTYLVPRGEATAFPDAGGTKIKEFTDGTSNTILTVEAGDDLAVTWTQPKDWEIGPDPRIEDLLGHYPEGVEVGFADGSVRFLRRTIKPETLKALLTRNGGEVFRTEDL